jgi:hypothetical protein
MTTVCLRSVYYSKAIENDKIDMAGSHSHCPPLAMTIVKVPWNE